MGWAHKNCNFLIRTKQFTHVLAHSLQNYDLHHVRRSQQDTNTRNSFSVIPLNDKKIVSLTMKVWIRSLTNEEGNVSNTYKKTRSVDSCKMIKCSLHELAQNLPMAKIKNLINHFASRPEEDKFLIGQKNYFPCLYFDCHA